MATATKTSKNGMKEAELLIPAINLQRMVLRVVGDSPLISHRWSDKAKKMMLDKQMKKANKKKEAKDPKQDFKESLYVHPDGGYGFPSVAFKAAAVAACRFLDGMKMTVARGAFHVDGELVKIEGDEPVMREDMVRLQGGVADIRYRGAFNEWYADLTIAYNADVISPEQVANVFNIAGFGVGVGEWRPERNGQYGRFHVAGDED